MAVSLVLFSTRLPSMTFSNPRPFPELSHRPPVWKKLAMGAAHGELPPGPPALLVHSEKQIVLRHKPATGWEETSRPVWAAAERKRAQSRPSSTPARAPGGRVSMPDFPAPRGLDAGAQGQTRTGWGEECAQGRGTQGGCGRTWKHDGSFVLTFAKRQTEAGHVRTE